MKLNTSCYHVILRVTSTRGTLLRQFLSTLLIDVLIQTFSGVGCLVGVHVFHGGRLLELLYLARFGFDAGQRHGYVRSNERNRK